MPIITYVRGPDIPASVQRVFLACPTTDKYHPPFVASLFEGAVALQRAGIQADLCLEVGNCHVDDARNSLVRHFLKTDCTDLIFIDADVGFCADDLPKLARFDRDVVAGVYPKKTDEDEFPIALASGVELWEDADGCVSKGVVGLPTGFMRIKRHVLETMSETFKSRSFKGQDDKPSDPPYVVLFEREIVKGRRYSGDYNFCRRWIELGGTLAVDPSMAFVHEGTKQWRGDLGSHWRRVHGLTDRAFGQAVAMLCKGEMGPREVMALWRGWSNEVYSGEPEMLLAAFRMAKRAKGPILECGSGLTTLIMALANPNVQIHALEHDPIWATKARDTLERYGIKNVTLHCHDLTRYPKGLWYDVRYLGETNFTLVLVDGPPMRLGKRAVLFDALADRIASADLIIDDIDTGDEVLRKAATAWADAAGLSLDVIEGDRKSFAICRRLLKVAA